MSAAGIGGKILDASAVAALVRGRIGMLTWLTVARQSGIVLYLPTLALAEVRALRSDAGQVLSDLVGHPWIVLGELDTAAAGAVDQILERASAADTTGVGGVEAGHVVHTARRRSWPVLTTDPARLQRLDPDVELDLL